MQDKHPTELLQELDYDIHLLENVIAKEVNTLEINKSKLENLKLRKQSLLNYLNDND